jgi:hypothetical protein
LETRPFPIIGQAGWKRKQSHSCEPGAA